LASRNRFYNNIERELTNMAVIVQQVQTGKIFILLGTSYSYFKDSRPSFLGGVLFPHEEEGEYALVAVSDRQGRIVWLPAEELRVLEADGTSPDKLLEAYESRFGVREEEKGTQEAEFELCPGCGAKVGRSERECPSCGLVLILEDNA
jgi:hypothetical protein